MPTLVTHSMSFGTAAPLRAGALLLQNIIPAMAMVARGWFSPAWQVDLPLSPFPLSTPVAADRAQSPATAGCTQPLIPMQRYSAERHNSFGFQHSLPSFLPAPSCLKPGPIPAAHKNTATKGETGKEQKKGQKLNSNPPCKRGGFARTPGQWQQLRACSLPSSC